MSLRGIAEDVRSLNEGGLEGAAGPFEDVHDGHERCFSSLIA